MSIPSSVREYKNLPDVRFAEPKLPKPKQKLLRVLRDAAGRVLATVREGEA